MVNDKEKSICLYILQNAIYLYIYIYMACNLVFSIIITNYEKIVLIIIIKVEIKL